MRIDLDYFGELLTIFLDSTKAHIDFNDIKEAGLEVITESKELSEKFIFHMQLALDNQLIGNSSGQAFVLEDIGITQTLDGAISICIMPIRLTQKGHDFAATLNNKEVIDKLKSEFKDAPFKVIFEGGQKLFQHYMKKKLDTITSEGS
ncbi:DUF2513 domain-containing protein [Saccharobesus litoralis]|uniref:DUF2513 domain-containing protein n=1 Tax=Saccharobesus litoralis TaxID=2172099 RepID=A0A2S0VTR1_9ALTE|nr:DUF2513 domain-containing protein [Saccharobesus litoralis]AWB67601.1 DUF2513 domain-containing protein [Saccharobesus litoralis]